MATVLGSCLIVLGAAVVFVALLGAGAYTLDWLHRRVVEPWRVMVAQTEHDLFRDRLMADSWWFSEDPPTMALVQEMASTTYDVSRARENWRLARLTSPQTKKD